MLAVLPLILAAPLAPGALPDLANLDPDRLDLFGDMMNAPAKYVVSPNRSPDGIGSNACAWVT